MYTGDKDSKTIEARTELLEAIERGARADDVCHLYAVFTYFRVRENKARASIVLDISRRTLLRWLRELRQPVIVTDVEQVFGFVNDSSDDSRE